MGGVTKVFKSIFSGGSAPSSAPTPAAAPAPQTTGASMESESSDAAKKKRRGKQLLMVQPTGQVTNTGLNL